MGYNAGAIIGAATGLVIGGGCSLLAYLSKDPSVNGISYIVGPLLTGTLGGVIGHGIYETNVRGEQVKHELHEG